MSCHCAAAESSSPHPILCAYLHLFSQLDRHINKTYELRVTQSPHMPHSLHSLEEENVVPLRSSGCEQPATHPDMHISIFNVIFTVRQVDHRREQNASCLRYSLASSLTASKTKKGMSCHCAAAEGPPPPPRFSYVHTLNFSQIRADASGLTLTLFDSLEEQKPSCHCARRTKK